MKTESFYKNQNLLSKTLQKNKILFWRMTHKTHPGLQELEDGLGTFSVSGFSFL